MKRPAIDAVWMINPSCCERMNGKVFSVDQQYGRVMQALGASDPQALRDIAPWPDLADIEGLSNDELQTSGYGAPPYHPGCRGMLSLVGDEEPASISLPQLEAAAPDVVVHLTPLIAYEVLLGADMGADRGEAA